MENTPPPPPSAARGGKSPVLLGLIVYPISIVVVLDLDLNLKKNDKNPSDSFVIKLKYSRKLSFWCQFFMFFV